MDTKELQKFEADIAAAVKPINTAAEMQAQSLAKRIEIDAAWMARGIETFAGKEVKTAKPHVMAGVGLFLKQFVRPGVAATIVVALFAFGVGWHFKAKRDESVYEKMGIAASRNVTELANMSLELAATRAAYSRSQADLARAGPCVASAPVRRRGH